MHPIVNMEIDAVAIRLREILGVGVSRPSAALVLLAVRKAHLDDLDLHRIIAEETRKAAAVETQPEIRVTLETREVLSPEVQPDIYAAYAKDLQNRVDAILNGVDTKGAGKVLDGFNDGPTNMWASAVDKFLDANFSKVAAPAEDSKQDAAKSVPPLGSDFEPGSITRAIWDAIDSLTIAQCWGDIQARPISVFVDKLSRLVPPVLPSSVGLSTIETQARRWRRFKGDRAAAIADRKHHDALRKAAKLARAGVQAATPAEHLNAKGEPIVAKRRRLLPPTDLD